MWVCTWMCVVNAPTRVDPSTSRPTPHPHTRARARCIRQAEGKDLSEADQHTLLDFQSQASERAQENLGQVIGSLIEG